MLSKSMVYLLALSAYTLGAIFLAMPKENVFLSPGVSSNIPSISLIFLAISALFLLVIFISSRNKNGK